MGTKFFQKAPTIGTGGNLNMEGRAISSGSFAGKTAGANAGKDIAAAIALYKAHGMKPSVRSAAYPKGPKI